MAYITGAEVFFRMTGAYIFYETAKYAVILFSIIGFFFYGFKIKAIPYVFYLLLLIPGILVSLENIGYDVNFRKAVLFNLSGPLTLGVVSLYCFGKTISFSNYLNVLNVMVYPLLSITVYVFLYTPDLQNVVTGTASNVALSGGYGPNQIATVLGLGVFVLFSRYLIPYKNKIVHVIMLFFLGAMAYRAILTFSRGGVIVSGLMIAAFSIVFYFTTNIKTKIKTSFKVVGLIVISMAIWSLALLQTGGMIGNRYENKDALGREKEDVTTGRLELFKTEMETFEESPFFGIGVGNIKFKFMDELGKSIPTHNEITRLLSEHGFFGVLALMVLILTPLIAKLQGAQNIYFFPFLIFWFLTISHSSMRIAAPAFVYGLALLHITYEKKK
ncbi:O-antigen ligase family protein [Marixanthomonas sp. SCSIO 43207]|uniref:O-antigen ligase family protein n=1 Tax=Marixanthomonas sp. SCSIO 43207 TaxID=2779360 RepID=UPI001CA87628|nr:O-antigen ligase family protein [Marixanthomonas sp. SCSIO 43207]UAB81208.1 O-antigen ligase family protein [Marixanthomonas sp. SCSIO 43207]